MKFVFPLVVLCLVGWSCGQTDYGDGTLYKLPVTQDVALERPTTNHNSLQWLLVSKHPDFPNKRSLLQFQDLNTACSSVRWARMYVYFQYAHKASWHSVQKTPWISRPIEVYQVRNEWNEAQVTSTKRTSNQNWAEEYLKLTETNPDAGPCVVDTVTIETGRPSGWVEFDVTSAVKNWKYGASNYGVLLRATNEYEPGRGIRFYSNAYSDSSKHAYINVLCD